MPSPLYDASVPVFRQMLALLADLLRRARPMRVSRAVIRIGFSRRASKVDGDWRVTHEHHSVPAID